jgi:competence protein ComEC
VIKVAHHGSNGSSSDALLDAVRPRLAVVSSGRNSYGRPGAEALGRPARRRVQVFRTDRDGAVRYDLESGAVRLKRPDPGAGTPGEPGQRRTRVSAASR